MLDAVPDSAIERFGRNGFRITLLESPRVRLLPLQSRLASRIGLKCVFEPYLSITVAQIEHPRIGRNIENRETELSAAALRDLPTVSATTRRSHTDRSTKQRLGRSTAESAATARETFEPSRKHDVRFARLSCALWCLSLRETSQCHESPNQDRPRFHARSGGITSGFTGHEQ
jgi:hypothetical protein